MLRLYLAPRNWPMALLLFALWLAHKLLPYRVNLRLCVGIGRAMYRVVPRSRNVMRVNLSLCYPDLDESAREELVKRNFEQWAISLLEIAISWWGDPEGILDNVEFIGTDHLDEAIARGKGVLLLGIHFSSFELGSLLVRKHIGPDTPMNIIYRNQKKPLLNAIMLKRRLQHVDQCVDSKDSRKIVKLVRAKQLIWYTVDHDHGRGNSVYAPFFGHPAATLKTTSTLVGIAGASALVMSTYRNKNNNGYILRLSPISEEFPTGDPVHDATLINQLVEKAIDIAPEQYMWGHRRFKTQEGLPKAALYKNNNSTPAS